MVQVTSLIGRREREVLQLSVHVHACKCLTLILLCSPDYTHTTGAVSSKPPRFLSSQKREKVRRKEMKERNMRYMSVAHLKETIAISWQVFLEKLPHVVGY